MGVQGLTPFLQKICPAVLKKLPNRLQDIRGKKIVIDGTLVTQRLHFGQGYSSYRHILGWYNIAKELDDNAVSAICVFDGTTRNVAKAREVERRRELRRLSARRASIENDRLQRLIKLKIITEQFQDFNLDKQRFIAKRLCDGLLTGEGNSFIEDLFQFVDGGPSPPDVPLPTAADEPLSSIDQTLQTFRSLSLDFEANVAQLASEPPLPSADEEEDHVYRVMTKAQNQLTADERTIWKKICTSMFMYLKPIASTALDFSTSVINDIHKLVDKSHIMSMSFQRRMETPSARTYQQSKEIIQAMGIPCIDAADATEAEALASAMVHQGLADFVATEDTDVLVYEVPMIKNITNRVEPLIIVSGAEVRAQLNLDRDSFIDFALLLGTDFSQRIVNVGPTRAYKFIKDHGSIERIVELETKYLPRLSREAYLAQVKMARHVFKTLPAVPPLETFKPTPKDDTEVFKVLQRYGLSRELRGEEGDFQFLLEGNYFRDNPSA